MDFIDLLFLIWIAMLVISFMSQLVRRSCTLHTSCTHGGSILGPSISSSGFCKRLKNLDVIRGASAIFRCVLRNDTEETGRWVFNDVALAHSGKIQIAVNGKERQLTVTDVQFADTGEYVYRVGQDKTSAHLSLNEAMCVNSVLNPPEPAMRRV